MRQMLSFINVVVIDPCCSTLWPEGLFVLPSPTTDLFFQKNVSLIISNLWTISAIVVLVFLFICLLGLDVVQIHSFFKVGIFLR